MLMTKHGGIVAGCLSGCLAAALWLSGPADAGCISQTVGTSTVHNCDGKIGVSQTVGNTTVHNFGGKLGTSQTVGNTTVHNFDGTLGTSQTVGNDHRPHHRRQVRPVAENRQHRHPQRPAVRRPLGAPATPAAMPGHDGRETGNRNAYLSIGTAARASQRAGFPGKAHRSHLYLPTSIYQYSFLGSYHSTAAGPHFSY